MSRWQLTPNSPLALQLAADARLSQTDYFDDQVWELALGSTGNASAGAPDELRRARWACQHCPDVAHR